MYFCPKCHAELPADARFCNVCGFNQTNARLAALTLPPTSSPPQAQSTQQPPSYAGIPQLDFEVNTPLPQPGLAAQQGQQSQQSIQNHNLTLKQRYVADLPTTAHRAYEQQRQDTPAYEESIPHITEPPTTPLPQNSSVIQPEIVRTSTPLYHSQRNTPQNNSSTYAYTTPAAGRIREQAQAGDTYRANTYQEQPARTETGELRQILRKAYKPRAPSVVRNERQQGRTRTAWIILGIVLLLIIGILAFAYFAFLAH